MKVRTLFGVCTFLTLILLIVPVGAVGTATIHGAIYEWDTFEPLENVLIEVNSTPPQSIVAKYGVYSLDLAPGDYVIVATYYTGNSLVASAQESITVTDDGDYIIDLLLLPSYENEDLEDAEIANLSEAFEADSQIIEADTGSSYMAYVAVLLIFFVLVLSAYVYSTKKGSNEKSLVNTSSDWDNDATLQDGSLSVDVKEDGLVGTITDDSETIDIITKVEPPVLPDDLREVLDIVIANGGRITQKDLRGKLRYSEAKVSLIVSDLENRGLVDKFKKGRGNIIIIPDDRK
ncbi:MAG: MarR family transcriptional regulator [Methanococcoides sp.]|nr:MarR family transcriptional regulator [Methanococcoides sp.]